MSLLRVAVCGIVAAACIIASARSAHADARSTARRYFQQGLALLEERRLDEAIDAFSAANETIPHPDVQYNLARACLDAGRIREALNWFEVYLESAAEPADEDEIQGVIERLRAQLKPAAPNVSGAAIPDDAVVTDQAARDDAETLDKTAADLRGLSPERAAEIASIAQRLRIIAQRPVESTLPPPPPAATPAPDVAPFDRTTPIAVDLPGEELRIVDDYEEREVVTAATGKAAEPQNAPAVVWVITQQEIRQRGYESIAEALRNVAGLHVIDDLVFVDVGVRGVSGGLRGMSRLIKVLINGQPVSFRPTSGNFLGPEMIPIRAVDRIELIRGPASALYGQNAFLGVLQIITRRGGDIRGGSVAARWGQSLQAVGVSGRSISPVSRSGELIVGAQAGAMSVLLTGHSGRSDRSGLALPESSPLASRLDGSQDRVSVDDISTPLSLFGSLTYDLREHGTFTLESGLQRLRGRAEWLDFGPLTHFSRVALNNAWVRLAYEDQLNDKLGVSGYVSYVQGGPSEDHEFRSLRPGANAADENQHLTERFGSRAVIGGAEVRWDLSRQFGLRIGTDIDVDREDLASTDVHFDADVGVYRAGDRAPVPEAQQPSRTFANAGTYLQLVAQPRDSIDLIGGLRFDYHNLYGTSINGRVGSVFRVSEGLFVKALYGSSFRAPAPDQLFHGAAYLGDTIGCQNFAPCAEQLPGSEFGLKPQTAHTGELVVGYTFDDTFTGQVTGYLSFVDDLIISFPTQGEFFVTTNAGTYLSRGIEAEFSARAPRVAGAVDLRGQAFLSIQSTNADIPDSQFAPPETESIRDEFRDTTRFPGIKAGGGLDISVPVAKLGLYLEGRYVGARRASGSNLVLGGDYDGGDLPPYFELDANLSTRNLHLLLERETVFSLRLTDIIGNPHAEGGFRGWDIPTRGRTVFVRMIQEF